MSLRLEAGPIPAPPGDVLLQITGAVPGEPVDFHLGGYCALDCPATLDGACFQPVEATVLGTAFADADGKASLLVPVTGDWTERWFVLQATAPDRRALSQPLLDRIAPWYEPLTDQWAVEVSFATLRNLYQDGGWIWSAWWPVAPGRHVKVRHTTRSFTGFYYDYETMLQRVSGGVSTLVAEAVDPLDPDTRTYDIDVETPTTLGLAFSYDYSAAVFDVDIAPGVRGERHWYPDLDADGFGDGAAVPVVASAPPPFTSTDATDCFDGDAAISPDGLEVCGDGLDQDCDLVDRACGFTGAALEGSVYRGAPFDRLHGFTIGEVGGQPAWAAAGLRSGLGTGVRADAVPAALGQPAGALAIGDGDADGLGDLVLASGKELVLLSQGDPGQVAATWSAGTLVASPLLGDVTGDGLADLLWGASTTPDQVEVRVGPLTSASAALAVLEQDGQARANLALGEATGDGIADLWAQDGGWHASPVPSPAVYVLGDTDILGIRTTDFDGDGLDDAALRTRDEVWLLTAPDWTEFGRISGYTTDIAWTPTRDADASPELLVATADQVWQTAPSPGVVDTVSGRMLGGAGDSVDGGDLDGDGYGEVIVGGEARDIGSTPDAGTFTVWWGP
jgi:hypothetical protein